MNRLFAVALCGAVGLFAVLPSANAQQKTEKACKEEWRANKAEKQAATGHQNLGRQDQVAPALSQDSKPLHTPLFASLIMHCRVFAVT